MSHTPGPWKFDEDIFDEEEGPVWCIEDVAGTNLVLAKIFADGDLGGPSKAEAKANAVLIAASPDLLAACREALEFVKDCDNQGAMTVEVALVRAIAKAEGESE